MYSPVSYCLPLGLCGSLLLARSKAPALWSLSHNRFMPTMLRPTQAHLEAPSFTIGPKSPLLSLSTLDPCLPWHPVLSCDLYPYTDFLFSKLQHLLLSLGTQV